MTTPLRPRRRTRTLALRVSPRELDILHRGALAAGITVSDLARFAATDAARARLREADADRREEARA